MATPQLTFSPWQHAPNPSIIHWEMHRRKGSGHSFSPQIHCAIAFRPANSGPLQSALLPASFFLRFGAARAANGEPLHTFGVQLGLMLQRAERGRRIASCLAASKNTAGISLKTGSSTQPIAAQHNPSAVHAEVFTDENGSIDSVLWAKRKFPELEWRPVDDTEVKKVLQDLQSKYPSRAIGPHAVATVKLLLALGVHQKHTLAAFHRTQGLLNYDVHKIASHIENMLSYGVSQKEILGAIVRDGQFLGCPTSKVEQTILFYIHGVGIEKVGKMVEYQPNVLRMSVATLQEKVQCLQDLGVEPVAKLVENEPSILSHSCDYLIARVRLLERLLPGIDVRKLLGRCSQLFRTSASTIEESFDQLVAEFGRGDAVHMVQVHPAVLGISAPKKALKLKFLTQVMGRDKREVVRWPTFLNCSLEDSLSPRFDALVQLGKGDLSIASMFSPSRRLFETRYGPLPPNKRA